MKHIPPTAFDNAEPIPSRKPRPKHYMAPTDRWDFETAIQADRALNFAAVKAAHVLLDLYNHHDGCAWPSAETIAERIGVTRSTASEAVNKLAARGWFKIGTVRKGNRQGSNRYVPCLEKAGLSVGPGRHSEGFSVGSGEPQRRLQPRLSVGSDRVSASATADTNPAREPIKENPSKESSSLAHARELPASLGDDDRRRSQVNKLPLPADYQFPAGAVAAARAAPRGLSEADIVRALAGFRKRTGEGQDTAAGWARRGAAYLATVEAKPDADEMVTVGGGLCGSRRCKRSEVRAWEAYTDSRGVRHPARIGKPVSKIGTRVAV